ncbi:MAG: hypothetical protein V1791_04565 [Pseudomonadota bacterium]
MPYKKMRFDNGYFKREMRRASPDVLAAYDLLDPQDQENIEAHAMTLIEAVPHMGAASALELLYKLGRFLVKAENGR